MRTRLLLLAVIAIMAVLGYYSGAFEYLSPDRMRRLLADAGPFGPILVIVLFTLLEPFGTPGVIFLLAAATLWPFWLALLVNWVGSVGAGLLGFAFARYFGRDLVKDRMPERLKRWDERLSNYGLPAVIVFRLCFFLNPASHWALGLSSVPALTALVGTIIGFGPWVLAWTYFGADILKWFETQSAGTWIAIAVAIGAFVAYRTIRKRRLVGAGR